MTVHDEAWRRETLTDVFASWALDGKLPTPEDLAFARAYIAGELTLDEILEATLAKYRHVDTNTLAPSRSTFTQEHRSPGESSADATG